ncbi:ATP-dependent helicase [Staphylospora marina]|uniref:ATP-dependent helicase n=1 Tax=Staphylospora marina TaxID=2490858 RepID=UPI0013DDDAB3|nr:ATP-dependent helicase [Staphylospora marina]
MHASVINREMLLDGLNGPQREAVTAADRHVVVFAGPGSGKTTVLTRRVLYLLQQGADPAELMVVTFTRAAAAEMKRRLGQIAGDGVRRWCIGTFHSLFLMLLREAGERIPPLLGETDQARLVRSVLAEKGFPSDDESVSERVSQIGLCKSMGILPGRLKVKEERNIRFRELFQEYEERKRRAGVWDYDDILITVLRRLTASETAREWTGRFEHILVDEFQDINQVQYEAVKRLAGTSGGLFVVGDDDQAIYGFRGSDPRFMLRMEHDFPGIRKVLLRTNYRSTEEIIQAGERLISRNRMRQAKPREGTGIRGPEPILWQPEDEEQEAEWVLRQLTDGTESAVLFRTTTQARALIDLLVRKNIPFFAYPGESSFYRKWQVQDVLAYLRTALRPDDSESLSRIINRPQRFVNGEDCLAAAKQRARETGISLLECLPGLFGLSRRQAKAMEQLVNHVRQLRRMSAKKAVRAVRHAVGYDRWMETFCEQTGNDPSAFAEPLEELERAAEAFPSVEGFLDHVGKVEQALENPCPDSPIKLMTLHKSKGLEFDRVFIIGLQAAVFPHRRALAGSESRIREAWEEERRLLYVGITRTRKELILSAAKHRLGKRVGISPFVRELGPGEFPSSRGSETDGKVRSDERSEAGKPEEDKTRFLSEPLKPGMRISHVKFGVGEVIRVTSLDGAVPGRKVLVRFGEGTRWLHFELSRQLGLVAVT